MTEIKDREVVERGIGVKRWGPWTGVAFFVLTVVSIFSANTPDPDAAGNKVIDYYSKHQGAVVFSSAAAVVGTALGLIFFGYVYAWLRRADRGWLPNAWLISTGVLTVALLIGGGSEFMLMDQAKHLTPDTAKVLNVVSTELFGPIGSAGVSAAMTVAGVSIWSHRSASRWYAITALIIAVVSLLTFFTPLGLAAFVLWILVFSIRLLVRAESVRPGPAISG